MRPDLGWRLDSEVTFLNHGSYGACPEHVLETQRAWGDRLESEPVRFLSGELPGLLAVGAALESEDRIQVPIGPWPVRAAQRDGVAPRILIRISAQRYNERADYERLADALRRRGIAP